jgi:hypothetical protein|uniref:hypothetical protein n=1 Tax=Candidatus Nanopelagicus sp. TaxID=2518620 RepID=UPI0040492701
MNFRLSASLLIAALALTSCGNSGGGSSKYDEVELIEYDNCLSSESEQWNLALTEGNIQRDLRPGGKFWIESENRAYQVEEFALSMCEKYRPKPIK